MARQLRKAETMFNGNQAGQDLGGQGKQPWFGPKRFGNGYGPRTWQGYLVTAVLLLIVVIVGGLAGAHSPWFIAAIAFFAVVHIAIIAIQRRR
jgi:hypothetical protein